MLPADATFDMDGRVRFSGSLSAANVSNYRGSTLLFASPMHSDVDPDGVYRMLRAPSELKQATRTFNGVPLSEPPCQRLRIFRLLVCGTIGTDAAFDGNLLSRHRDVVVAGRDRRRRECGEAGAVSVGFYFYADMTPGMLPRHALRRRPAQHLRAPLSRSFRSSHSGVGFDGRPQQPRREAA